MIDFQKLKQLKQLDQHLWLHQVYKQMPMIKIHLVKFLFLFKNNI
jgi:hypothetical protein